MLQKIPKKVFEFLLLIYTNIFYMNNEIINEGKRAKNLWLNQSQSKLRVYNEALEYSRAFVTIETNEDKREFSKGFKAYVSKRLKTKVADFGTNWEISRLLSFFDCSENVLDTLQSKFTMYRQVELNEDCTKCIEPDFSIYAESKDEIRRLDIANRLLSVLKEISVEGYSVNYITISQGCSGVLDATAKNARPSIQFVKRRR